MSGRGPVRPRIVLSVNEGANGGRAARQAPLIRSLFASSGVDVVTIAEASREATIRRAREELGLHAGSPVPSDHRPRALVVAGGDGAVHAGLQAVAGTAVPLGVIPIGSGNDIARDLGLAGASVRAAVDTVVEALHAPWRADSPRRGLDAPTLVPGRVSHGRVQRHDALRIRQDDGSATWALAILSAGLDASVSARTNELRRPPGAARYLRALLEHLPRLAPYGYRLTIDGRTQDLSALVVAVANTRHFGGGMRIAPAADPTDGWLDVVIVDPLPLLELVRVFPRIYRGTHVEHEAVRTLRAREVRVEPCPRLGAAPPKAMADGEPVGALPLTVHLEPGAVSVVRRTVEG